MRRLILNTGKRLCIFTLTFMMLLATTVQFVRAEEVEVLAPSFLLMENSTGKILYEKNSHERRPLASITKIMTMLLAMEQIDSGNMTYDDIITGSAYAKSMGGSTIFLDEGEKLSVRDIMKGIAVASGNDAAVAMAEHISGTEESFVARMNERAAELGMKDTHFMNPHGLDVDNHYSSAYDIALMSRELLKHPDIHNFTTIWMDTLRDGQFTLSNTNKLIRFYDGATGLKTGSTSKALSCLSATAKRDNMHLIAVVMASPTSNDRFSDASKLLNYGFANYGIQTVNAEGERIGAQPVSKGVKDTVDVVVKTPFDYLAKKGEKPQIEKRLNINSKIRAPITKGTSAGKMEYYIDNNKIGESELIFNEDIEKRSFWGTFIKMIKYLFSRCAIWE